MEDSTVVSSSVASSPDPDWSGSLSAVVVGAGLAGSLMAILLADQGFSVEVHEQHEDPRQVHDPNGRSINLTLATRGVSALREAGVFDMIAPATVPLAGREVHSPDGACTFHPYGTGEHEVLFAANRRELNAALITTAEARPGVRFVFRSGCVDLDKCSGRIEFRDETNGARVVRHPAFVVGADGLASAVRRLMQRGEPADFSRKCLEWDYKELTIPAGPARSFLLEKNALHVWPRGGSGLLVALPNRDGSFNVICCLPRVGDPSFASLTTEAAVVAFFLAQFDDVAPLMPTLAADFLNNPTAHFVSVRTAPGTTGIASC
jgi:kynurenine 3-monooxygenase